MPARELLQQALDESGCSLDLETALQNRALALPLINYAEVLARAPKHQIAHHLRRFVGATDWRSIAANDKAKQ